MGHQAVGGQAAFHQVRRRWGLEDAGIAAGAGITGLDGDNDPELGGNVATP